MLDDPKQKIQELLAAARTLINQAHEIAKDNAVRFDFMGEAFGPWTSDVQEATIEIWESSYSPGC